MKVNGRENKRRIVDEILSNSIYQPDSGLVVNLRIALLKLSASNLHNLRMVMYYKIQDEVTKHKGKR